MSSNEEDYNDSENPLSKRRRVINRACDICRRKKGDGGQMPGNRCSNCIAYSFKCTYVEAAKKRGPPKGYVERLETRVEKLEKALTRVFPDSDILKELNAAVDTDAWLMDRIPRPLADQKAGLTSTHAPEQNPGDYAANVATSVIRKISTEHTENSEYPRDDDFAHVLLADHFKNLHIDGPEQTRFFGKSSAGMLVHTAMELKNEYTGEQRREILGSKRDEFWVPRPWERNAPLVPKATLVFPEDDLVDSLLDIYFEHFNLFHPLLHRPSFLRSIAEGLHLRDDSFGANLLLVCAVASRLSNDPRVLMDGVESGYSGGWKWFHMAHQIRKSLLAPPTLLDLQFYCLSVTFLHGSSAPQSSWTMVGIGIRLAQDVGAHRRKYDKNNMTVEDELWKRAFWVLVTMDRMASSALGRPCAIQEEDFDVDFPVECDDEYWEHPDPAKRFKQPPNKPSYITGFNLLLKLNQVMGMMLRTIYSINKHKANLGLIGKKWDQQIVAELDSALNKWVDSVPDHLRWDPTRKDARFFQQSAWLYSMYYNIQILIHRSFIPSPSKPSPLSFPSLAICTNAARSCCHIIDIYHRRDLVAPPQIQMVIFTAGIVLLLNLWGGKRSGLSTDPRKEMSDVHMCMQVLRKCEARWPSAGRLWDILYELASVGELPLPSANTPPSNKRDRDSDSPASSCSAASSSNSPSLSPDVVPQRTIAGSRRAHALGKHPQSQPTQVPFTLPLYSDELGRFPISSFGGVPQETASMLGQSQGQAQGASPMYWGTELPAGAGTGTSAAQYGQPDPPIVSLPFSMDFYSQLGFGLGSPPFAQPSSAPGTQQSQSSYGTGSLGAGTVAMQPDLQRADMTAGQGQYAGMDMGMQALIDSETVAMWSNAPSGFELDDWGTYLTNVSQLTHGMYHPPGGE